MGKAGPNRNGDATRAYIRAYHAAYIRRHGVAPTQREIASDCYLGRSTVQYELRQMTALGMIERVPNALRSIRLVEQGA